MLRDEVLFIFSVLAEAWRFCANIDGSLEVLVIRCSLTEAPVPAEEQPPAPGFAVVWCSLGDLHCCFCAKHIFWSYGRKDRLWFHRTVFTHALRNFRCVFAHFQPGLDVFLRKKWLPSCNPTPWPRRLMNTGDCCHMHDTASTCQKFL